MSKLTEEELALLTEEEREGYLADDEDDDGEGDDDQGNADEGAGGEEGNGDEGDDDPTLAVDDPATAPPAANPQDGGEGGDAEPQEQIMAQPKPLFNADLPADIEAQRTALDEKEAAIDQQYDEGDILFTEHKQALRDINKQRNALDRAELKAELAAEAYQTQIDNSWQASQEAFFSAHPEFKIDNEAKWAAFDQLVKNETKSVLDKGGAVGVPELERAYTKYKQAFNIEAASPKQAKAPAAKNEGAVPPNLGKLPAATANDTDDGKFAHLDRLEGVAFEDALAKLSDAQRDEYLRSA